MDRITKTKVPFLVKDNYSGAVLNTNVEALQAYKAKKNDFSPHKCDYLKPSYSIDSANKTTPPVISNIHIWLFL